MDLILMPKAKPAQSNNLEQSKVEIGSSKAEIVLSRDERLLRGVFQLNKENSAYGSETPNKISKSSIYDRQKFWKLQAREPSEFVAASIDSKPEKI